MRRVILTTAFVAALGLIPASAVAAANPSGTGQPNQSCQAVFGLPDSAPPPAFPSPNGFNTGTTTGGPAGTGFANATGKYAGSGFASSTSNNPNAQSNPNAVSQYDVACYQTSQQH
jgi:hypothetical protein